jgi:D-alanyl-D-alanine carboxypeptidase
MKNPIFREIVQTKFSSVRTTAVVRKKLVPRRISVRNHNRLLWNFEGAIGGKTGYTHAAQKCFVGAVQRNGATLIVAILGSRNLWNDTKRLLEYGFDHYSNLRAAEPGLKSRSNEQHADIVRPPAPKPAQADEQPQQANGYVLQVATFRERERAETVFRKMSEDGFEAFMEPTLLGSGETAYRVRVGPYIELLEAQETAQDILNKSGHKVLILPIQSVPPDESDPS